MDDRIVFANHGQPDRLVLYGTDRVMLITIHLDDRTMEFGPTYEPDKAAQVFWDAVLRMMPREIVT